MPDSRFKNEAERLAAEFNLPDLRFKCKAETVDEWIAVEQSMNGWRWRGWRNVGVTVIDERGMAVV